MTTEEKKNYRTKTGACSLPDGTPETTCEHCTPSMSSGFCIYRAWAFDKCLSPFALTAARGEAAPIPCINDTGAVIL